MASIRGRDTKPEILLRRALRALGRTGYRCNLVRLPGRPDIVYTRFKLVVFVDGAYWHGHPSHVRETASTYWHLKIDGNRRRDVRNTRALVDAGWTVLRVWDFEVEQDAGRVAARIAAQLRDASTHAASLETRTLVRED